MQGTDGGAGGASLAEAFTREHHEIDAGIEAYLAATERDPAVAPHRCTARWRRCGATSTSRRRSSSRACRRDRS